MNSRATLVVPGTPIVAVSSQLTFGPLPVHAQLLGLELNNWTKVSPAPSVTTRWAPGTLHGPRFVTATLSKKCPLASGPEMLWVTLMSAWFAFGPVLQPARASATEKGDANSTELINSMNAPVSA